MEPDWSPPYGDTDVSELLATVRESLPATVPPGIEESDLEYRRTRTERAAIEAQETVEVLCEKIFNQWHPPFSDAMEAAHWIESQVQPANTRKLSLELTVPSKMDHVQALAWFRDRLNQFFMRHPLHRRGPLRWTPKFGQVAKRESRS